jgi:hypothetical protein
MEANLFLNRYLRRHISMYEFRSEIKVDIPGVLNVKSFKKWVSSQRALFIQKEIDLSNYKFNPSIPSFFGEVNFLEDGYLLIQPEYDIDKGVIYFFEDVDGIPEGYHIRVRMIFLPAPSLQKKLTKLSMVLVKDEPEGEFKPIQPETPKPKKKSTGTKSKAASKKTTSAKKKTSKTKGRD